MGLEISGTPNETRFKGFWTLTVGQPPNFPNHRLTAYPGPARGYDHSFPDPADIRRPH